MIDFVPGLSPFSVRDVPKPVRIEEDTKANPFFQFFMSIYYKAKYADRILFDSVYDLESSVAEALREEAGFSVCHVGPLFMMSSQTSKSSARTVNLLQEDDSCLSWLDKQQESSVLYISFGSVVTLEYDVISELASGLEASGLHFLWVIRPDALSGKASVEELLPEGFIDRTHSRGCVISWAPQLAVLAHPSIGAFLTHCGWNSVLESLSHGVPMLGFPQQAEQNTNLKFIVHDWKVGLPLLQPNMQRIELTYVQDAMTVIMKKDEGKEVRRNALHFKKVILNACNGSSKSNLEKLVQDFISGNLKAPAPLQ
ncbi:hypothetical protein KP509_16G058500 [Ceratopteris richardii]|nr:hypothetical protein KP509_16G058500 [Ceratopteris richardii]